MPVYGGDLDKIGGVGNTKGLFHMFSLKGLMVLEDARYSPLPLRQDDCVVDALELFCKERRPLAVVRDDAGKVHGPITMEDALKQIVGPIEDEHDRPPLRLGRRPPPSPRAGPKR